jgi:hypothetical protein
MGYNATRRYRGKKTVDLAILVAALVIIGACSPGSWPPAAAERRRTLKPGVRPAGGSPVLRPSLCGKPEPGPQR